MAAVVKPPIRGASGNQEAGAGNGRLGQTKSCLPPWKPLPKRPQFIRPAVVTGWPRSVVSVVRLGLAFEDDCALLPWFWAWLTEAAPCLFAGAAETTDGATAWRAGATAGRAPAAVAGIRNISASTAVARIVGMRSSFFIWTPRMLLRQEGQRIALSVSNMSRPVQSLRSRSPGTPSARRCPLT